MTYIETMAMKILGEMAYNYGNQPEVVAIVERIIADTKRACCDAADMYQEEAEKCRGEVERLKKQLKSYSQVLHSHAKNAEKQYALRKEGETNLERSRREVDYWRKRAKKAEAKDE